MEETKNESVSLQQDLGLFSDLQIPSLPNTRQNDHTQSNSMDQCQKMYVLFQQGGSYINYIIHQIIIWPDLNP